MKYINQTTVRVVTFGNERYKVQFQDWSNELPVDNGLPPDISSTGATYGLAKRHKDGLRKLDTQHLDSIKRVDGVYS